MGGIPGLEKFPERRACKKIPESMRRSDDVRAAAEKLLNSLELAALVIHVADTRTGVLHPASTTHRQLSDEEQKATGILPELIRVSVGLEHIDDIIADFEQALAKI